MRGRLERKAGLDGHLVGWRKAREQLAELEVVEDAARLVVVVARPACPLELQIDRHVADDRDHPLAEPDLVGMGVERGLEPALGQLVDSLEQGLDADEVLDQLGRRLVPHAWYAGDVVRRVPAQGFEVNQLRRLEAVALPDLLGAVEERVRDAAPRHERLHRLGDELEAVEVAGDDGHGVATLLSDARQGADHVVCLEALDSVDRDGKRVQHLADHVHLRPQVVRHGAATCLVLLVFQGPERGFPKIEGGDRVLRPRGEDDGQHRGEAIDGVGHPAIRGAHGGQREKRAVDEAVGVDQNQPPASPLRHVRILRRRH